MERSREEEKWYARSRHSTPEVRADAIALLTRVGTHPPEADDDLPQEYASWRQRRDENPAERQDKRKTE